MYGFEGHGFTMIFRWLFVFFLIGMVFYYATNIQKESPSAKEILDKKYADGKIDTEEYHKRLEVLDRTRADQA